METPQGLEHELYRVHVEAAPRSTQDLLRLFGVSPAKAASVIPDPGKRLRLLYELDAMEMPTSLEQYSIRYVLEQFVAAGHTVIILLYDESWHTPLKVPSPYAFTDNLVSALQNIAPQQTTLCLASELRQRSTVDMLYSGLDAIGLRELLGSAKGVDTKNSSRSMEPLLRRGFSRMAWRHFAADVIMQVDPRAHKYPQSLDLPFLTIPRITTGRSSRVMIDELPVVAQFFHMCMSIPDERMLDTCRYMLTLDESMYLHLKKRLAVRPLETKKQFAVAVTALWAGSFEVGLQARGIFEETVNGQHAYDMDAIWFPTATLFDVLAATNVYSRSELRRLFTSGAVRNTAEPTQKLAPSHQAMRPGDTIRIGKKHRVRIRTI